MNFTSFIMVNGWGSCRTEVSWMRWNELFIDFPFLKCRINAGTRYTNMKVFIFILMHAALVVSVSLKPNVLLNCAIELEYSIIKTGLWFHYTLGRKKANRRVSCWVGVLVETSVHTCSSSVFMSSLSAIPITLYSCRSTRVSFKNYKNRWSK